MLRDLQSAEDILEATGLLLGRADVRRRLPTPVDDIVAAAKLTEPEESILSDSALSRAPAYLREAVARLRYKVKAVLDRKTREVHLSPEVENDGRRRFKRLHEVTHDILPWQRELAYADDESTLAWTTDRLFEQEANQGAAELLFQQAFFGQIAADYEIGIAAVVEVAGLFGGSIHAAFRRYVETHAAPLAGLMLAPRPVGRDPVVYRRHEAIHSRAWSERFEEPRSWPFRLQIPPYNFLALADRALYTDDGDPLDLPWQDLNGSPTEIRAEAFCNQYRTFVLLWKPRREFFKRRRILVAAPA